MSDLLEHYGTKGMKWGVRKTASGSLKKVGNSISKTKEKVKTYAGEQKQSKKRELSWKKAYRNRQKMSDDDLGKVIKRLRMENDLKRLSKESSRIDSKLTDQAIKAAMEALKAAKTAGGAV